MIKSFKHLFRKLDPCKEVRICLLISREPASPSFVPDYLTQILREGKAELEKRACVILKA